MTTRIFRGYAVHAVTRNLRVKVSWLGRGSKGVAMGGCTAALSIGQTGLKGCVRLRQRKKTVAPKRPKRPAMPPGLGARAKGLWTGLHKELDSSKVSFSAEELELFMLAVEAVDRCDRAQRLLAKEGVVVKDRFGQAREHPAVAIRNSAETNAAKLLRQLGLKADVEKMIRNSNIRSGTIRAIRARG